MSGEGIVTGRGFIFKKGCSKKVSNDILSFGFLFKRPNNKFDKSDDVPGGILGLKYKLTLKIN